jgi:hypothetical protein
MIHNDSKKGGDAYGKVPKRIVIAKTIECRDWRREILRSAQNDKSFANGFAEGKRKLPGPGKS